MVAFVYQSGSAIEKVQVRTNEKGGLRAYIHAAENCDTTQLAVAKESFTAHGWKFVPTIQDGKPVLEVRGFKKPSELTQVLASNQLIHGVEKVEREAGDVLSPQQKLRHATLTAAGLSYNVGDIGYMTYVIKKWQHDLPKKDAGTNFFNVFDIVAGMGYAAGSLALTRYGHGDRSQIAIETANSKIKSYLADTGITTPDDSALAGSLKQPKRGFWARLDNLFAKYPSETFNSIYIAVGTMLGAAAFYRAIDAHTRGKIFREESKKLLEIGKSVESKAQEVLANGKFREAREEAVDIGLGAMTLSSAMVGLLVKEKKIDENDRRQGLGRVLDWVQEKPLRATGFGYMISTLFHAKSTHMKYKSGDALTKNTIIGRGIFVLSNIVSEVMLFVSSKGHGEGVRPDKSIDQTVLASVADLIMHQPVEKRETLAAQLSGYIASPDVLGGDVDTITESLREHLKALESNPWAAGHRTVKAAPAQSAAVTAEKAPEHHHDRPRATISAARELLPVIEPNKAAAQQLAPAH